MAAETGLVCGHICCHGLVFSLTTGSSSGHSLSPACNHGGDSTAAARASFTDRLRQAVAHQAWLLALDAWHLVTAVLASLLALVTLVRALDFLAEAALRATSLREVRILALRCAWDAIREIWELLSLFIVWRMYRCIVRAAVFGLLLPASCLVDIPPRLQMLSWVVLCSLPWTLPGTKPWMALALACLSLLPFFCCKAPALPQLQLEARWRLG